MFCVFRLIVSTFASEYKKAVFLHGNLYTISCFAPIYLTLHILQLDIA